MTPTSTIKTFVITTASLLCLAATASAGNTTFVTSFAYDKAQSAETNYTNFQAKAATVCRAEIRRAGYRPTEIGTSALRNDCERELLERAVNATKNHALIAYHNYSVNPVSNTNRFARK